MKRNEKWIGVVAFNSNKFLNSIINDKIKLLKYENENKQIMIKLNLNKLMIKDYRLINLVSRQFVLQETTIIVTIYFIYKNVLNILYIDLYVI